MEMKYMGSKDKYAKYLLPYILADRKPSQYYVEPFVGGCNMIDKVSGNRIGSDCNMYLIAMWQNLQAGWLPPQEITREIYNRARVAYNDKCEEQANYIGYIGFNGSYGGRFFDGGYAGITTDKYGKQRNYPLEAYNNVIKQLPKLADVKFIHSDYRQLQIPANSLIYCDWPYENTKKYSMNFDHESKWDWLREQKEKGHTVFASEYSAPSDFKEVVALNAKSSLRANSVISGNKTSIEKLFTL